MISEERQAIKIGKRLQEIGRKVSIVDRKKVYRNASKILIKQAKANTPVDSGLLKKSIKVLPIAKKQDAVFVGPRISKKSKKQQPFYAHWIEYGKEGFQGVAYMRRAYDSTKEVVLKAVQLGLIEKYKQAVRHVSGR